MREGILRLSKVNPDYIALEISSNTLIVPMAINTSTPSLLTVETKDVRHEANSSVCNPGEVNEPLSALLPHLESGIAMSVISTSYSCLKTKCINVFKVLIAVPAIK